MKRVHAGNPSPLSSFFRSNSDAAKRAAYGAASARAIESQRKVLEQAKNIRVACRLHFKVNHRPLVASEPQSAALS